MKRSLQKHHPACLLESKGLMWRKPRILKHAQVPPSVSGFQYTTISRDVVAQGAAERASRCSGCTRFRGYEKKQFRTDSAIDAETMRDARRSVLSNRWSAGLFR